MLQLHNVAADALPNLAHSMITQSPTASKKFDDFEEKHNLRLEGGKGGGVFNLKRNSATTPVSLPRQLLEKLTSAKNLPMIEEEYIDG